MVFEEQIKYSLSQHLFHTQSLRSGRSAPSDRGFMCIHFAVPKKLAKKDQPQIPQLILGILWLHMNQIPVHFHHRQSQLL